MWMKNAFCHLSVKFRGKIEDVSSKKNQKSEYELLFVLIYFLGDERILKLL